MQAAGVAATLADPAAAMQLDRVAAGCVDAHGLVRSGGMEEMAMVCGDDGMADPHLGQLAHCPSEVVDDVVHRGRAR